MTGKHIEPKERAELVASLDAAEASLARGEGRPITQESMKTLARDVTERNRHRFPAEQQSAASPTAAQKQAAREAGERILARRPFRQLPEGVTVDDLIREGRDERIRKILNQVVAADKK